MKQLLATLLTLALFIFTSCSQIKKDNEIIQRVDGYLTELEKIGFYGSKLVEMNGDKMISKGYGFRNKERQIKNSFNTIYDIGSVTKQFTATAILKLEMQGKLSTEDKLSKFFNNVQKTKKILLSTICCVTNLV